MHVFTHTFDYIALGILIACMLLAAAKSSPARSLIIEAPGSGGRAITQIP